MSSPSSDVVSVTFGYHPVTTDLAEILGAATFDQLLVYGPGLGDVAELVGEARVLNSGPVQLPQGVYWFSGVRPSAALAVLQGAPAGPSMTLPSDAVPEDSALSNALAWLEQTWDDAVVVPRPRFTIGQDVVVDATGHDGIVRPSRRYVSGGWLYTVFSGGQTLRHPEASLSARPVVDDASTWVTTQPESPRRFAATLTRAKLAGQFTDTVFSFRATRTLFRPYQFKPVQKLLNTGALRLLIADEVGLGKTIEAGLVWTELEARRQADRVLVVCPSALVTKWKREMEERFGFDLVELTTEGLADLLDRLESNKLPRRVAYVTSIERLRMWDGLERATELSMQLDLVIVDEAHAFRNSDTKSYELGEHLQSWAEALVMLSATPVNLRNRDLFNLLALLVPGEFEDLTSLEERLSPNRVLNRITKSLLDPATTNEGRREWLEELGEDPFGQLLTLRPDFAILRDTLAKPDLTVSDAVHVKRLCAELHGLSAQVTRTRKVEIQEEKPLREPRKVAVAFDPAEAAFYDAYFRWCVERAAFTGSPLNFAMQMPLRLAGSCLPEAARSVLEWTGWDDVQAEDGAIPPSKSSDVPPRPELVELARELRVDTKYEQFEQALSDLVQQGKKTIVFTFSRRTLGYMESRAEGEFRVCVLHGGVPKRRRDELMKSFRDGAYDVLLATRVASEGLDFEFCSAVINYDLPWNPMEVEQRIGRIDRIGQLEKKIGVLNFHTPGTIETDIIERVMDRIGVFEHAIGELEPILESGWRDVEEVLFDFTLSLEQRDLRSREMIHAIEAQAQAREEIESAAPMLVSSDGADIEGLERDLVSSGRYVGQGELELLLRDWAETFGGHVERAGDVVHLRGNDEMADHVQRLARSGERTNAEVAELASALRADQVVTLSLDQEASRQSGIDLLTATHPLTRAALGTPGYRQARFTLLRMESGTVGVPAGRYLTLLAAASWSGLRPLHEVWASTIDLETMSDAGEALGLAVMKELALGRLAAGPLRGPGGLVEAVDLATFNLEVRAEARRQELERENDAFIETRRLSFEQVHQRRMGRLNGLLRTHRERGNPRGLTLTEARIRKEEARYAAQLAGLDSAKSPSFSTDDLAVCVIEVSR